MKRNSSHRPQAMTLPPPDPLVPKYHRSNSWAPYLTSSSSGTSTLPTVSLRWRMLCTMSASLPRTKISKSNTPHASGSEAVHSPCFTVLKHWDCTPKARGSASTSTSPEGPLSPWASIPPSLRKLRPTTCSGITQSIACNSHKCASYGNCSTVPHAKPGASTALRCHPLARLKLPN